MEMQSLILIRSEQDGAVGERGERDGFVTKIVPDCRGIRTSRLAVLSWIGGGLAARVGMSVFVGVWLFREFGVGVKFH